MKLDYLKEVGKVYGHMTVLRKSPGCVLGSEKHRYVDCLCECGEEKIVRIDHLKTGKTTSCGCFRITKSFEPRTHGMSKTRPYRIWRNMITRCHNPNYAEREYYGGRGISVCDEWRNSFEKFYADMGHPGAKQSIDRIDGSANYCKENCRWATAQQQVENRRPSKRPPGMEVEYRGSTYRISDLSKILGVSSTALYRRHRRGAPLDQKMPRGVF